MRILSFAFLFVLGISVGFILKQDCKKEESNVGKSLNPKRVAVRDYRFPGKWKKFKGKLYTLPYLTGYKRAVFSGGVVNYEKNSYKGCNLYVSGHSPSVVVVDMNGNIKREVLLDPRDIWPDLKNDPDIKKLLYIRSLLPLSDGSLVVVFENRGIARVSLDGKILWSVRGEFHHDVSLYKNKIVTLMREGKVVPFINNKEGVYDDYVVFVDLTDGKIVEKLSILEALYRSDYSPLLLFLRGKQGDILHSNSVSVINGDLIGRNGNLIMVSVRELSQIIFIDKVNGVVVWSLGGLFAKQHDPIFSKNGELFVFDNLGTKSPRVVKIDVSKGEIKKVVLDHLYSLDLGGLKLLPNGNLVVIDSWIGRVLEIDDKGRVVWDYFSPFRAGDSKELVASLFDFVRVESNYVWCK